MEINNIYVRYDINRKIPPNRILVSHVNDVNTRVIELALTQGDEALVPESDCIASAAIVERRTKMLINDGIACTVTSTGTILVPIDNLHFRNKMDIHVEVSVCDSTGEKVLALPYPLWIRVNPSILDNAEIAEESLGTVPELLEEAKELVENYHYEPTRSELEQIAQMVDVSGKADKATTLSGYGITDAYTKNQVDAAIQTAIGGVENGAY